jgi:Flp pilus assembly protein TadD
MQQLERACRLAPDIVAPKLALAELYTRFGFEEQSRELIAQVRNVLPTLTEKNSLETGLDMLEAESWLSETNATSANAVLQPLLQSHPDDAQMQAMAIRAYVSFGDYSNALELVNARLQADPKNIGALVDQAAIYFRMGAASNTVAVLDSALAITNALELRLLRAAARVNAGQLDLAENDYRDLDQTVTNHLVTSYGLARIAQLRHDTNNAVFWLQRCLTNTPAGSQVYQLLDNQIRALKATK